MTCYFRHLKEIFAEANIAFTSENKKAVDQIIHEILGVKYKNCPSSWRKLKETIKEGSREVFIKNLKNQMKAK